MDRYDRFRRSVQNQDIMYVLRTWNIPMDLFGPLSRYVYWNVNHLEILLELFPDKPWDWFCIPKNPNITQKIVQGKPGIPWHCYGLSIDFSSTANTFQRQTKPWSFRALAEDPDVIDYILRPNIIGTWEYKSLSMNPNITWEFVFDNKDRPWDWYYLSRNPIITWEIIQGNIKLPWSWSGISMNPNVTWEIVQGNPEMKWDWIFISMNPNITWEIVYDNRDKPWSWAGLSCNKFQRE